MRKQDGLLCGLIRLAFQTSSTRDLPVLSKTACASLVAASWRILLTP